MEMHERMDMSLVRGTFFPCPFDGCIFRGSRRQMDNHTRAGKHVYSGMNNARGRTTQKRNECLGKVSIIMLWMDDQCIFPINETFDIV